MFADCLAPEQADWNKDTKSSSIGLSHEGFVDAMFEIADLWTPNIDPWYYWDFLVSESAFKLP